MTRLTRTAKIGITGPNGTRKTTFLSGYFFLNTSTARAVGMYWKKRKTTLRAASTSNVPVKSNAIAKTPEMMIAKIGAFLELVSAIF